MSTLITDIDVSAFSRICWSVGTPVAFKALKALERCDWFYLSRISVKAADYVCPRTYLMDAQVAAFFKKRPGLPTGVNLKEEAIKAFWDAERECYHSNERLNPLLDDLGHHGEGVKRLVVAWRKKIRSVLRRAPTRASLAGRFGPGTTFLNTGDLITVPDKLSTGYSRTSRSASFLQSWDMTAWSRYAACSLDTVGDNPVAGSDVALYQSESDSFYAIRDFEIVRGNRFTTVPKDSRKDRGICIEPSLNVFYQLAIGEVMTHRMARTLGWQKESCQDFHKSLARIGSLTGAVATIDLSSASDSICSNLVKLLLPPDWYQLVTDLRSSHTFIQGKWVKLEKFSSMGNGFTFELETLLFFTLGKAIEELEGVREDPYTPGLTTSVFGDDIIVPTSISKLVVAALEFFGFKTNLEKTFLSGKFRESCGGDYFSGHDVRPFFNEKEINEPHHIIALANGLRRFGRRLGDLGSPDLHLNAWFCCLDSLPRAIRNCRGPEALGDLVVQDDESRWLRTNEMRVRNCIRYLRVWRPIPNRLVGWEHYRPGVTLAAALYGCSSGAPPHIYTNSPEDTLRRSGVVPRLHGSYVQGYKLGRVAYS